MTELEKRVPVHLSTRLLAAVCPSHKPRPTPHARAALRGPRGPEPPLPSVVLAVEQPVEDLAQGADVMQIVQDDDERHVHGIVLAGALVSEVGQVLAQFLWRPGE